MSADELFLDLLYQAPAQPDRWIPVLERLADMVSGGVTGLDRYRPLSTRSEDRAVRVAKGSAFYPVRRFRIR